ncbi:uncharacterized protein MELLADRAFT_71812 [Melampsora larici-populina 98AG31]|uniref:Uncharacterized protein n=1 Tax=Melampsora larici-populina (strain 98AG31 / pathotype 3-4-7) TaxID=747676 RepID=F4RKQ5_MELLP|nr:uncharacterized protein MELLADRAFT_71812 [Melampsora larici-populina 98AG31]EGG07132.1 hypothetical protein MELLADRAFT_71812 [Melampsora larici-populina 98AG31]
MNIRDVLGLGISWGMAMKLFAQSCLFYKQIKKEISTCNRISAREGPYHLLKKGATSGASESSSNAPQAGPSQLPYTGPPQGSGADSVL